MGWRYQYILIGGLSLVMATIRIFFMKMEESPKWFVSQGRFDDAVGALKEMARINKTEITITAGDFEPAIPDEGGDKKASLLSSLHFRGLFANKKQGFSTSGVMLLWACIGVAYV